MKSILWPRAFLLVLFLSVSISCKKDNNAVPSCETININLFSLAQDRELGAQVDSQLVAQLRDTILDTVQYAEAYSHLKRITDAILNSGKVENKDKLVWKMRIINQDVLNAFCTPGGYIYVYSGIIKYLDSEDDLAGVLGHEIAHADRRHSTKSMTRDYGISTLLSVVLGQDPNLLVQIANGLAGLKYSRCHESEADAYSVNYLSPTEYKCNGAASFFEKLGNAGSPPEFLSTHPNPDNRVQAINDRAFQLGCKTSSGVTDTERYQKFKKSLPNF
jgi:predicted Zn-dependent protease